MRISQGTLEMIDSAADVAALEAHPVWFEAAASLLEVAAREIREAVAAEKAKEGSR